MGEFKEGWYWIVDSVTEGVNKERLYTYSIVYLDYSEKDVELVGYLGKDYEQFLGMYKTKAS